MRALDSPFEKIVYDHSTQTLTMRCRVKDVGDEELLERIIGVEPRTIEVYAPCWGEAQRRYWELRIHERLPTTAVYWIP